MDRGTAEGSVMIVHQRDPFACGEVTQALVPRGCGQPAAYALGVLDSIDVLKKPEPGRLDHVGCVALGQFEVPRHRPDEPRVLVNQALPRPVIANGRAPHQVRDVERTIVGFRRCRRASQSWSCTNFPPTTAGICNPPSHTILLVTVCQPGT